MLDLAGIRRRGSRLTWDLQRFGLTPAKLARRSHEANGRAVLIISIPKAGTHFTERMICLHPSYHRKLVGTIFSADDLSRRIRGLRGGEVLCAHVRHSPDLAANLAENDVAVLFAVRDPRDILVSRAHFIQSTPGHPLTAFAQAHPDLTGRIGALIDGDPKFDVPPLREILEGYAGWLTSGALSVRFEHLANPELRPFVVRDVFAHLEATIEPGIESRIADRMISDASPTFRRGKTGEWRDVFTDELEGRYDAAVADIVPALGYASCRAPDSGLA
jgi:hypothetical protein